MSVSTPHPTTIRDPRCILLELTNLSLWVRSNLQCYLVRIKYRWLEMEVVVCSIVPGIRLSLATFLSLKLWKDNCWIMYISLVTTVLLLVATQRLMTWSFQRALWVDAIVRSSLSQAKRTLKASSISEILDLQQALLSWYDKRYSSNLTWCSRWDFQSLKL